MWNRVVVILLVWASCACAQSEPKFSYVERGKVVKFSPGAWCYNAAANAVLITATAREKESCKLQSEFDLLKERAKYDLEVGVLKSRISSMVESHESAIAAIKSENERLSKLAMNKPASKSVWFAAGGFTAGMIATIALYWVTSISR
jgi:hypothetical protein